MKKRTFKLSESFKARADSACFWEAWVAAVLAKQGLWVRHTPFVLDGTPAGPDLSVGKWNMPAEVKSQNLTFNCAADYPKDRALVCSYNSWRRKVEAGDYLADGTIGCDFFLVSRETGAIVWVPKETYVHLTEVWDSDRSELYKAIYAAKCDLRDLIDYVGTAHA